MGIGKFVSVAVLGVFLVACTSAAASGARLQIEKAWARPALASSMSTMSQSSSMQGMPGMAGSDFSGSTSAVYFILVNDGDQADTLTGVTTDVASQAEMHETSIKNDIAQMAQVAQVVVPAHGKVEFSPGGFHVMLGGLKRDLKVGDSIQLTLHFKTSGDQNLTAAVQEEP